ncbi:MAG: hypothetical protein U0269_37105 [Polyangiales bacterium]
MRAAQVAFAPVAWCAWWAALRVLDRSVSPFEPVSIVRECARACGWVALLWLIARVWRSLQWPAVVAIAGSLAGPWFHGAIFEWLDRSLVVMSARVDFWLSTPWEFILPRAVWPAGGSFETLFWGEVLCAACVAAVVGLASKLKIVRYSALAALLLFAAHAWLTASIRASVRPSVETWMRDFEEIERVPVARVPVGDWEYGEARVRRLADGSAVWRVRYSESELTRGVELAFGRSDARFEFESRDWARLSCDRGDVLVVRRREFPRTSFAACERDGVIHGAPVATRDAWFALRRINGVRHFALPTEWIERAKIALFVALAALFAERCARRWLAGRRWRASRAPIEGRDERREHPYRGALNEPRESEKERGVESAEALDQWAIVAMALHVAAPVIVGVLAEKNVPQW